MYAEKPLRRPLPSLPGADSQCPHRVGVTNKVSVATGMEAVWNTWGALHIIVNNAGSSRTLIRLTA